MSVQPPMRNDPGRQVEPVEPVVLVPGRVARWGYVVLGCVCVGIGTIGIFLPLLPTTIFIIIAAWAFARSSPRLQSWLYNHPRFGSMLVNWYQHRVISRRAKVIAVLSMAGSLAITGWTTGSVLITAIAAVCLTCVAAYLVTRPSTPEDAMARLQIGQRDETDRGGSA